MSRFAPVPVSFTFSALPAFSLSNKLMIFGDHLQIKKLSGKQHLPNPFQDGYPPCIGIEIINPDTTATGIAYFPLTLYGCQPPPPFSSFSFTQLSLKMFLKSTSNARQILMQAHLPTYLFYENLILEGYSRLPLAKQVESILFECMKSQQKATTGSSLILSF